MRSRLECTFESRPIETPVSSPQKAHCVGQSFSFTLLVPPSFLSLTHGLQWSQGRWPQVQVFWAQQSLLLLAPPLV